jgi:hypothetical protein
MERFERVGVAMLQSHAMSRGRVIFLVAIVVTFCALFIGFYVWMRRPGFRQAGGGEQPTLTRSERPPSTVGGRDRAA